MSTQSRTHGEYHPLKPKSWESQEEKHGFPSRKEGFPCPAPFPWTGQELGATYLIVRPILLQRVRAPPRRPHSPQRDQRCWGQLQSLTRVLRLRRYSEGGGGHRGSIWFGSILRPILGKFVRFMGFQWCHIFILKPPFSLLSRTFSILSFTGTKPDNNRKCYPSREYLYFTRDWSLGFFWERAFRNLWKSR